MCVIIYIMHMYIYIYIIRLTTLLRKAGTPTFNLCVNVTGYNPLEPLQKNNWSMIGSWVFLFCISSWDYHTP